MISYILIYIAARIGIKLVRKYVTRPLKMKKQLKKYSNTDTIKIIELPDSIYEENQEIDPSNNELYKKAFNTFCSEIERTIPKEDLGNYYRNFSSLEELKIPLSYKIKSFITRGGGIIGGGYSPSNNKISLSENFLSKFLNTTCHELLHASSAYYDKKNKIAYAGLSQIYEKTDTRKPAFYGTAINEGYTELLNQRLFNKNKKYLSATYLTEQKIAGSIEQIVGEDKMKSFYFNSNLYGLVNELKKYSNEDDIFKFINYTDLFSHYIGSDKLKSESVKNAKTFINQFLIKAYAKSLKQKGEMDMNEVAKFAKKSIPYNDVNLLLYNEEKEKLHR